MDSKPKYLSIIFYKDHFQEFFKKQRDNFRDKIIWTLELVVLMNRFQKKDQKTPKQEIQKALKIKQQYENDKR